MLNEPKGTTDMARAEHVVGADKEGRPSPIDVHVGSRIRLRRTLLGMSQERLGEALGLTFQQVQKYERGVNRVGASRLFDLSRVLDVPISFFFDDMPDSLASTLRRASRSRRAVRLRRVAGRVRRRRAEPARDAGTGARLLPHHRPAVRKRVFDLIKSMGPADG